MKMPFSRLGNLQNSWIKLKSSNREMSSVPNELLSHEPSNGRFELEDQLDFEPEEDPEDFFGRTSGELVQGSFVVLVAKSAEPTTENDADWEVDVSPIRIEGDGVRSKSTAVSESNYDELAFLKVQSKSRRSVKRSVVPTGTRFFIESDICLIWVEEVLKKGWFTSEDLDTLVSCCVGNGEFDELRFNAIRTLEAEGLQLTDEASESPEFLFDNQSSTPANELAEALEVTLTRATSLPGKRHFNLNKSGEAKLLGPVVRAKQELQLGLLACESSVQSMLSNIDRVFDGSLKPAFVTIKSIVPSRPGHKETAEFKDAFETLRRWNAAGRVMDGKRRRDALWAMEALELSLLFYKAIVNSSAEHEATREVSIRLNGLVIAFEAAIDRLLLEHLSFTRRFAARNVEEGEDLEDVFQVAFIGLQRATRRFDPERGHRFAVYSAYWMKQAVMRWRADEGATIRIPVHRQGRFAEIDRATLQLEAKHERGPTEAELATELGWDTGLVQSLLRIPRCGSGLDELDRLQVMDVMPDQEDVLSRTETSRVVLEVLASLPKRQADVIRMRFGIGRDDEMTLEEIGQIYGVTRERIRQIEAKGLGVLSNPRHRRRLQALVKD